MTTEPAVNIDTARLRALAEAATPGARSVAGSRILVGNALGSQTWGPNWRNDQAFIAATDPQTVLALLDEIDRYRDTLARILGYTRGAVRRLMPEELAERERELADPT